MTGNQSHILVVEDDDYVVELLEYNLSRNGCRVSSGKSGDEAIRAVRKDKPDLIVLDLMLPGIDGLDVCRILKGDPETSDVMIMMVTAKGEAADVVRGFEVGADDYVTKPFNVGVLVSRINALLKRKRNHFAQDGHRIVNNGLVMDLKKYEVLVDDEPVNLTRAEFRLLRMLLENPGFVFIREEIIRTVHGPDYAVSKRSVDVLILGIRKKHPTLEKMVHTVRGVGYKLRERL